MNVSVFLIEFLEFTTSRIPSIKFDYSKSHQIHPEKVELSTFQHAEGSTFDRSPVTPVNTPEIKPIDVETLEKAFPALLASLRSICVFARHAHVKKLFSTSTEYPSMESLLCHFIFLVFLSDERANTDEALSFLKLLESEDLYGILDIIRKDGYRPSASTWSVSETLESQIQESINMSIVALACLYRIG